MQTLTHKWRFRAATFVMPVALIFMQFIRPSMEQGQQVTSSASISAMIIFGDSTVDVGMNNNLTTPVRSNFRPYGRDFIDARPTGRFCNGRVPVDFLATLLGIPYPLAYFDPNANGQNIVHGINFASSASGYNDNTAKFFNVISLPRQVEFFRHYQSQLAEVVGIGQATQILSEAVYVLSTGTNDFANNYFYNFRLRRTFDAQLYVNFLLQSAANFMESLYQLGARKLGIASIPPIGCLPAQRFLIHGLSNFSNCVETENNIALAFNGGLQNLIESFNAKYSDYMVVYLDTFEPLIGIYQNPGKYGIEVVTRGCCSTGLFETTLLCDRFDNPLSCPDATKYMFWDSYHPTEIVYKNLADVFYKVYLETFAGH